MPKLNVSVIIPTLNEAAHLGAAIDSARHNGAREVIVVDGGSTDATLGIAVAHNATRVLECPPMRARQMNAGANTARGKCLVFLHADTILLPGSLEAMVRAARDREVAGGGFARHYSTQSRLLRASSRIGNLRARQLGWFYGDQAIWARRAAFRRIGGYPVIPRFEDLEFARRLMKFGRTLLIRPGVETSARRFDGGVATMIVRDALSTAKHVCLG